MVHLTGSWLCNAALTCVVGKQQLLWTSWAQRTKKACSAGTTVVCGFLGGRPPRIFCCFEESRGFCCILWRRGSGSEGRAPTETVIDCNPSEPRLQVRFGLIQKKSNMTFPILWTKLHAFYIFIEKYYVSVLTMSFIFYILMLSHLGPC